MSRLPLAFALAVALVGSAYADDTFVGVVTSPPDLHQPYPVFLAVEHPGGDHHPFALNSGSHIRWHIDPNVSLSREALRPGTRVRIIGNYHVARVYVVTLGPVAMSAAVEQWVAEATASRRDVIASYRQVRAGERQHIVNAAPGTDLALSPGQVATIEALGNKSWFVREAVTEKLRGRGVAALRIMIWAAAAPDPEIRRRAAILLRELGWPD